MHIHWFPGHMTKALRMMEAQIKLVDVVAYVLDARAPAACINEKFGSLTAGKSVLYILNKTDLADEQKTRRWNAHFSALGNPVLALNATESLSARKLVAALDEVDKRKADKFRSKGALIPTRVMVIGVPNSGKSTIINTVCGRKAAITGNKPGVTRGTQWVRLSNNIELMDTPGTLYPNFEDQQKALHLAFIGSIRDEVVDTIELASELVLALDSLYPQQFREKYGITQEMTAKEQMLQQISKKRGCLVKGGELDIERGAAALLDDFRKGKIGRFTLEAPQ